MRLRSVLLGFFLLLAGSGGAQLVDTVTVEVVDVPVFVSRNGTPIDGLEQEDFELYVNGNRHPIDYFDVVSTGGGAKDADELRQRRLFLLLFDLAFTDVHGLGRARQAAMKLVADAPAGDLFAVASYSSRRGVRIASPFTRDSVALTRAIATLGATESGDPLSIVPTAHALLPGGVQRMTNAAEDDIGYTVTRRAEENQVLDLSDVGRRLAALQGQKHVVLMSSGFDGPNRNEEFARVSKRTHSTIYGGGVSPRLEGGGFGGRVLKAMKELGHAFQASDVFLHTLDVEGLSPTLQGNASLAALAGSTGGRFIHSENDLGRALGNLSDTLGHGYVLGFIPRNAKKEANEIEVRVRGRRGTTVRHRQGFSGASPKTDVADSLYLADVVVNDVPQTGTAPTLLVDGAMLAATVPLYQLAAQMGQERTAELLVYFFDATGAAVGFRREVIPVPPDAGGDLTVTIALPERAKVAKALLRVNGSLGFSRVGV